MSRYLRWSCGACALLFSVQWCGFASTARAQSNPFQAPNADIPSSTAEKLPGVVQTAALVSDGFPLKEYATSQVNYAESYGSACGGCGDCCESCGACGDACACGATSCGSTGCDPCGRRSPFCEVYADCLYLHTTDADITHAQQQDGLGGAGTVPYGDIGTVDHDYSPGLRIGGAIACDACSAIAFSFTHFESDTFSSLEAPAIMTGAVGSLVHHPGAAITASAGPVDAEYEVSFQLADFVFRHRWLSGPCYSVDYHVGAQYGHLEQEFEQTGVFSGGGAGTIDTTTSINFDGGGLKAGIEGERDLGHRFSTYGRLTAAAMSGQFTSRYTLYNSTAMTLLGQANWKDDRVISHVEYEFGLAWTSCNKHWRWATGYMFSHWGNVVNTPVFIDAVQADNYVDVEGTISFDGLVSRFEARW